MPTQVPVEAKRSWMIATKAAFMLTLLAAVIMSVIVFIIVWAYTGFSIARLVLQPF